MLNYNLVIHQLLSHKSLNKLNIYNLYIFHKYYIINMNCIIV